MSICSEQIKCTQGKSGLGHGVGGRSYEISVGAENFQELSLPLLQLNKNIPIENRVVEENPSEKQVKAEILKLYELSDKCTEIIKPIFSQLNDDSVLVGLFMDVLNHKATEQAIYEKDRSILVAAAAR